MMAKISKNIVLLAGVLFCAIFLTDISPADTKKTTTEKQVENPYENSRILVEAFVVEVKLDALYKSGVGPVGQRPNSVSMEKILKCLRDKDKAKVTAGAKIAARNGREGQMRSAENRYIEREVMRREKDTEKPVPKKILDNYEISTQFNARAFVKPDSTIHVEFRFGQSTVETDTEGGRRPNTINRQWNCEVSLDAGKPSIVGATQNDKTVVFLVIVADIENK